MTVLPLRRLDADDATLLRRARRGDRRARRLFVRRHAARAVELTGILAPDADDATSLASTVLNATIAAGQDGDDALVRAALRALLPVAGERGLARIVVALTAVDGRTEDAVADLIERPVAEVSKLRTSGQAEVGATSLGRDCRGWPLAARRDRLTERERDAANGHLMLCRPCRARLDEQRRTRDKLKLSSAAASAVVVADVVSLSAGGAFAGAGGWAAIVAGKAGVAVAGAAILAVGAGAAGVAVARDAPSHRSTPVVAPQSGGDTAGSRVPATPPAASPRTRSYSTPASTGAVTTSSSGTRTAPSSPTAAATTTPTSLVTVPLPLTTSTSITTTLTPVPLPLPTAITTTLLPLPSPLLSTTTSLLGN